MSQNTPPGQGPDDRRDVPPPPPGGAVGNEQPQNPYFNRAQAQTEPDLDAAAPRLRTVEERRLDRKALLFLGGILLLILAMGYLLLRKGTSDDPTPPPRLEARTSTPDLPSIPTATPVAPPADPIPMLPSQDVPVSYRPELPSVNEDNRRREPTLLERRIAAAQAEGGQQNPTTPQYPYPPGYPGQPGGPQAQGQGSAESTEVATSASFIRAPDALLVRGTYLRCVLETRIITDVPGYTSCLLTEPVYSINGRQLLLPKGSKIYGSYNGGPVAKRVDVIWDRITTPNGIDVAMSSPGTDGLGGAGVPGQFTAHWPQRIASALMISLIADAFKYAAAENGPETTSVNASGWAVQSPYESATARTMERLANQALDQQRPPTVTVNQGTLMNVYVAKDVDFTAVLGGGGK